jgi:hypothetical protein
MDSRIRRPRHATVVAYLALFLALGGTGYAAVKINGSDLVNNSVAGKKLKRGTIGAREVNESRLGRVRSAANATRAATAATAGSAGTASSATNAGHATTAGHSTSAGFASRAGEASNASLLGGLGPQNFLSADTVVSGVASLGTSSQILAEPSMGFAVNALPTDGDGAFEVEVRNTRAAGGADIAVGLSTDATSFTVAPGDVQEIESADNVFPPFLVADTAGTQPGVLVICGAHGETAKVYCYGVLT